MTDPLRFDAAAPAGDVSDRDRNARLEELLLSGLDYYFAGHYELAINVWTRVLFLDRGHARARAYIERARSAVSERQREGEELIQTGAAAFQRGEVDAARRLLTSAVERGAETEEALALLGRLDRLEAAGVQQESRKARPAGLPRGEPRPDTSREARRSRMAWIATGALLGIAAGALAIALVWARGEDWLLMSVASTSASTARSIDEPLRIPSTADARIALACSLTAKGRVREAVSALEAIRPGDPAKLQADAFRASLQAQLLIAARGNQSGATPWKQQESGVYCQ
jgi:hypothetical protein